MLVVVLDNMLLLWPLFACLPVARWADDDEQEKPGVPLVAILCVCRGVRGQAMHERACGCCGYVVCPTYSHLIAHRLCSEKRARQRIGGGFLSAVQTLLTPSLVLPPPRSRQAEHTRRTSGQASGRRAYFFRVFLAAFMALPPSSPSSPHSTTTGQGNTTLRHTTSKQASLIKRPYIQASST